MNPITRVIMKICSLVHRQGSYLILVLENTSGSKNPTSVPCSWELSLKDEVVRHDGEGSHGDSWRDLGMHCCVVKHLTTWP